MANVLSYLKYNKCALNIQDSLWPTVRARTQSIYTRRLAEGITCGILAFPEHLSLLIDMRQPRKKYFSRISTGYDSTAHVASDST